MSTELKTAHPAVQQEVYAVLKSKNKVTMDGSSKLVKFYPAIAKQSCDPEWFNKYLK